MTCVPPWKRLLWILLALWLGECALAAACVAAGWIPVSARFGTFDVLPLLHGLGFVGLLLGALASLPLGLACLIKAIAGRQPRRLLLLVPLALPIVLLAGTCAAQRRFPLYFQAVRDAEFSALAERSRPLTAALAQYMDDHGRAPATLEALVPEYLAELSPTGIERYPRYRYQVFASGFPRARLLWYDAGARRDRLLGDWRYGSLGPLESSILVVIVDAEGQVLSADTDRLGSVSRPRPFDAKRWSDQREARADMLADLVPRLIGLSLDDVHAMLGPEDGSGALEEHFSGAPYELTVPCPLGQLNWDVFVYWPSEAYPDQMYGGWVERIGSWAYVHE